MKQGASRITAGVHTFMAVFGLWAGLGLATTASAAITFVGSAGNLSASVAFADLGGGNLQVTLANTSPANVDKAIQILTGVFFNVNGNPVLTPVSALLNGSSVIKPTSGGVVGVTIAGGNVGGEWAYARGTSPLQYGAYQGISSSGLGIFGNGNFNGPDLEPPLAVDGVQYGITGTGTTLYADGIKDQPLIKSFVVFTMSGLPINFSVSDVTFQYGTALNEGHFAGVAEIGGFVPEPRYGLVSALLLLPLAGLPLVRRRRQA